MNIPPAILTAFPPSRDLLLDVARRQVDDEMLRDIARADYQTDIDLHLAGLRPIRDEGIVPDEWSWHPGEVLQLVRFYTPDDLVGPPNFHGRRGHQICAFACAALLRGGDHEAEVNLAKCLVSARTLGDEMNEAAGRFLTWALAPITNGERCLFAAALLVIVTRFWPKRFVDVDLAEAAEWVLAEEAEIHCEFGSFRASDPRPTPFGVGSGFWKPLADELLDTAATIQSPALRDNLTLIGSILLDP